MKRILSVILTLLLLAGLCVPVWAQDDAAKDAADRLNALGLFQGTGTDANGNPIYELDRMPKRSEVVTMLVRLLGREEEAKSSTWSTPFTDVPDWAKPYVGYAYENGLVKGVSDTQFGSDDLSTATMYITLVLRALGYADGSDFRWNAAWELSDRLGITDGSYNAGTNADFTRGGVAIISSSALDAAYKGGDGTLLDRLIADGAVRTDAEPAPEPTPPVEQPGELVPLSSEQIYARCMPAVFYIEVYDDYGVAFASGSGFFIDGEGTAVTNHHVIRGATSAKVTLADSRGNDLETLDVLGVYDWSEEEDWAVLKVDVSGNSFLRVGDPATAVGGAAVYALGSPLGFSASISDGIISNPARVDGGQTYIQISAPISHGSSGGALVNKYGDVIGITAAGYDDGQNLNLAVPIEKIADSARGDLTPISQTYVKPSGIVYPAQRSVTLRPGETVDDVITAIKYDTEELLTVVYKVEDESIVTCAWDGWDADDTEVTLHLTAGNTFGTTTVAIYLYTKDSGELLNSDYIYVTVAGGELTLSKTETEIDLNGYDVVWITAHCFDSRTYKLRYSDPSSGMLNLSWGDWSDDAAGKKIGLYMAALSAGSTELTIEMFDADTGETLATAIVHVHVIGGRLTISETDLVMRPGETYTVTITGEPVVPGVVTNLYADEWPSDVIDWKRGLLGSGTVELTVTAKTSGWDCINISLADAAGNILADGWIDVYVQAGTITAETEELTVLKGETQTVMFSAEVFNGRPVTFLAETSEGGAVSCAVGAWDAAAGTIPVTVTGLSYGSAYVSLVMLDAETEEFLTSAGVSVLVPGGTLTISDTELMLAPGESKVVTITGAAYEPGVSAVISADEWGSSIFDYPQGELGVGTAQLTITAKAEGWDFMLISMTDAEGNFLNEQWIEVYVSADGKGADE